LVEGAKILGDLGARLVVIHLKAGPDPTLSVPAVGVASTEALTEGLRVGQLVREVQQRPEDGGRLRVGAPGTDADVGRAQSADPFEESRAGAYVNTWHSDIMDRYTRIYSDSRKTSPIPLILI